MLRRKLKIMNLIDIKRRLREGYLGAELQFNTRIFIKTFQLDFIPHSFTHTYIYNIYLYRGKDSKCYTPSELKPTTNFWRFYTKIRKRCQGVSGHLFNDWTSA
jgi:hypothetical protein